MATIPLSIAKHIRSIWMAEMIMTYLYIDKHGNLMDWGGYPQHYGLTNLTTGKPATEGMGFLEGLLEVPHTQVLQFVDIGGGRSAHMHVVPLENGTIVLMFDATAEHDRLQKMQQQFNELSILTYRQSQLLQELEKAHQQLAEEKRQIEEASELKSRFIKTLLHELRTPLTSIINYCAKLLGLVQSADAREANYLDGVKKNVNHLLSLIDDVQEQAKLKVGKVELRPSSCDVKQFLADLKLLFFPTAQEKGLVFETDIQASMPARLMIDELRFRQVLINLVYNALKFTEQGFVRVTLSWQADRLEFAVADSSPGISPDAQQKIFTAFHHESTAHTFPGAGLGLAISHHLVNLMEGCLTVESSLGEGSIFKGFIQAPLILPTTPKKND
jgi:signal transduction histidine kinase